MIAILQKPPVVTTPSRRAPLLQIRLSDGHSWAHEFGASNPHDLRDGCFEGFVGCAIERQRRANALPAYQTIKRANIIAGTPRALALHVQHNGAWLNANYGTNSEHRIIVRQPGTATNSEGWDAAPWEMYWLRCLRCWNGAEALSAFCRSIPRWAGLDDSGAVA